MKEVKLKAKLLGLLTGLSNEITRRKARIEEAKKLIKKEKVDEDLTKMYNELETLIGFTEHIAKWFEETAEEIKREAGVE